MKLKVLMGPPCMFSFTNHKIRILHVVIDAMYLYTHTHSLG